MKKRIITLLAAAIMMSSVFYAQGNLEVTDKTAFFFPGRIPDTSMPGSKTRAVSLLLWEAESWSCSLKTMISWRPLTM